MNTPPRTSLILLAGGLGYRFGAPSPKQFHDLSGKPIARHSLDCFLMMPEITEIIVVCAPKWQCFFPEAHRFALPGIRRQDSVYNGLQFVDHTSQFVCIHDSARPLINPALVQRVLDAGYRHGAAASGLPLSFTIKEVDRQKMVQNTPNRDHYWEVQTPQVINKKWLLEGFEHVQQQQITVTDDVSFAELLNKPVAMVEGAPWNLKITNFEDLAIAEQFFKYCHE